MGHPPETLEIVLTGARTLPDYGKPPVVEVAITVRFRLLPRFKTAHYGGFWALHREKFPRVEDQPPILETVPPEFMQLPPLRRVLLIDQSGTYLMQIQPDLFAQNWRRIPEDQPYPHFAEIKQNFNQRWKSFADFAGTNELGEVILTSYEVTYVNQIVEVEGSFPAALERYSDVIRVRSARPEHFLPDPVSLTADLQFQIPEEKGILRVSFKHGARATDRKDVMQIDIIARSKAQPDGSDLQDWLEVAHTWIVRGFTDLTSERAHQLWERTI